MRRHVRRIRDLLDQATVCAAGWPRHGPPALPRGVVPLLAFEAERDAVREPGRVKSSLLLQSMAGPGLLRYHTGWCLSWLPWQRRYRCVKAMGVEIAEAREHVIGVSISS